MLFRSVSQSRYLSYCLSSSQYSDVFICDGYRLCRAAKLLMSLGYGNFTSVIQYDIFAMSQKYLSENGGNWSVSFRTSKYALDFFLPQMLEFLTVLIFPFFRFWLTIRM